MESNEKRARRPRIGQQPTPVASPDASDHSFSANESTGRQEYQPRQRREYNQPYQQRRDYQPRYNNPNGGYQRQHTEGEGEQDSYRRPRYYSQPDGEQTGEERQYQPRPYRQNNYNNNRQGGYNNNRQ
ncbi:MAG: hypothetical protein K2H74_06970, partial [Paramuribaculum sp.]|nr:hypothetical protein [Paramuribaculum sp.]